MTPLLIALVPGVALSCGTFLFFIAGIQAALYLKTRYKRSKNIALFSLFAGFFALEHVVAQTRYFSPEFTHYYVMFSTGSVMLSYYFYMKSIGFFIAVPDRLYQSYTQGMLLVFGAAVLAVVCYFLFGYLSFFDPNQTMTTANYFINSYTQRIGAPSLSVSAFLSVAGFINVVGSLVLLRLVWKSSRDVFFIIGLSLSILTSTWENFLLSFTFSYFVPITFFSNLFEAYRMNSLAAKEYASEKRLDIEVKSKRTPSPDKLVAVRESYQNSHLSEQRLARLAEKVKSVLEKESCFTNPSLSSDELARKVGIPTYQLSQVINLGLKTSFYELVSSYRIEYVKKQLKSPQNSRLKIIDLAYQAGFNSKSAFNTSFKKITGQTPSEFRKTSSQKKSAIDS